jgi:hypothetical protein
LSPKPKFTNKIYERGHIKYKCTNVQSECKRNKKKIIMHLLSDINHLFSESGVGNKEDSIVDSE